ncbi:MAG: hypothetical protein ACTHVE_02175 [Senegalia sp. (in: firmicutes)]|uniref:hypothetical protein n=1 Tax=Senegalia sp. (in: firmicutes) TaxID=1924098 RepID=UPI003F98BC8E
MTNIEKVKNLYEENYRCIRYENDVNGSMIIYFKNFEKEKIEEISSSDSEEIDELKAFIDEN